jgi:hypothetical protein
MDTAMHRRIAVAINSASAPITASGFCALAALSR